MQPAMRPRGCFRRKIMAGDKKAIQAYKEFIQTGSSDYPVNILKKAGVDMTTTEPFQSTIRIFHRSGGSVREAAVD